MVIQLISSVSALSLSRSPWGVLFAWDDHVARHDEKIQFTRSWILQDTVLRKAISEFLALMVWSVDRKSAAAPALSLDGPRKAAMPSFKTFRTKRLLVRNFPRVWVERHEERF